MTTSTRRAEPLLAGPYNARLGPLIYAFNLPAEPHACIGATGLCSSVCYAKRFLFQIQLGRHRRHYERSLEARFADAIAAEIRPGLVRVVRIHTSGDFHDAGYVRQWARVARAGPGTTFFASTRSGRRDDILAERLGRARLPNVHLWFSEDPETGRPPAAPGVRRAYLLTGGEDGRAVPADAELVFRVAQGRRPGRPGAWARPMKRANGVLVCPKEQGVERQVAMTCSRCRICFTPRRGSR